MYGGISIGEYIFKLFDGRDSSTHDLLELVKKSHFYLALDCNMISTHFCLSTCFPMLKGRWVSIS